jgi:hypothetical protein
MARQRLLEKNSEIFEKSWNFLLLKDRKRSEKVKKLGNSFNDG